MSTVNPLSSTFGSTGTGGSTGSGLQGLSQNDFLNLMVAQLQNQDPLNPISTDTFLQEMASFTEVVDLQQLVTGQMATEAFQTIGRTVTYTDPTTGQTASGQVSSVQMVSGQPVLTVGQVLLPMSLVTSVSS